MSPHKKKSSSIFQTFRSAVISIHGNIRPYFINGHVVKVQFGAESQVVSAAPPSLGTHKNKTSTAFKPKKAHKRARPCIFILKILDFVLPGAQSVPMQENWTVSLLVFTLPIRSEMKLRCFTALLIFPICSYAGKFWFQKVSTMSLWALDFYEVGDKKDKCYSCLWICLLSFPLSTLLRVTWFTLRVIWVSFTWREKIMVTSFEIYASLSKKKVSEYFCIDAEFNWGFSEAWASKCE